MLAALEVDAVQVDQNEFSLKGGELRAASLERAASCGRAVACSKLASSRLLAGRDGDHQQEVCMNCANHADQSAVAYCRTCGKALCANCNGPYGA